MVDQEMIGNRIRVHVRDSFQSLQRLDHRLLRQTAVGARENERRSLECKGFAAVEHDSYDEHPCNGFHMHNDVHGP
jgi:hypothetical protein